MDSSWHPFSREVFQEHWERAFARAKEAVMEAVKKRWTRVMEELKLDYEGR